MVRRRGRYWGTPHERSVAAAEQPRACYGSRACRRSVWRRSAAVRLRAVLAAELRKAAEQILGVTAPELATAASGAVVRLFGCGLS
ncbi:hypothetical protein [Paenibacillus mucilaginosus]|uniref:hypothetical protein n=1 Tax=Paenibacillus mucilaginosus TaxID=61624 RepID=UPI00117DF184|nr:hypothetical protein [Paenibacillus mucilaginosus]